MSCNLHLSESCDCRPSNTARYQHPSQIRSASGTTNPQFFCHTTQRMRPNFYVNRCKIRGRVLFVLLKLLDSSSFSEIAELYRSRIIQIHCFQSDKRCTSSFPGCRWRGACRICVMMSTKLLRINRWISWQTPWIGHCSGKISTDSSA